MNLLRVGMLHLAPQLGCVEYNRSLVESGMDLAAEQGADWVLTPELCVPGYTFTPHIGTDWILAQPDEWMAGLMKKARSKGVTVFLSHPERDPQTGLLYNSVFVIGPSGDIMGSHRKIKVTGGAERWSSPGDSLVVVDCGKARVGLLVCADSWFPEIVSGLKDEGAEILVSAASWADGEHGPEDSWERRTLETGCPLWVCNRTGWEEGEHLDFSVADSAVVHRGRRLLEARYNSSTLLCFDWDLDKKDLAGHFTLPIHAPQTAP